MRPLSVFNNLWGNRRRIIPVFAAVGLSVFLICTMQLVVGVPMRAAWRELVEPYRNASVFAAKTAPLSPDFVGRLLQAEDVASVTACASFYTNIDSVVGGTVGTQVLALGGNGMMLDALGLSLMEGRLPQPGSGDIALHEMVARNKGLWIGDVIGSEVQDGEVLEGRHSVCGILRGEAIISITSLEYELAKRNIRYEYSLGAIAVAKPGRLQAMNRALEHQDNTGLILRTLGSATSQYQRDTSSISTLITAIGLMMIVIVSVCAGFLSYIHFLERRSEFGILSAIGYTEVQIVNRAFAEISIVNLVGLGAGLLLSAVAGVLMNALVFGPKGLSIWVLDAEALLGGCCVPLFTTLFSVVPVWRMLRGLDTASVLEGQP